MTSLGSPVKGHLEEPQSASGHSFNFLGGLDGAWPPNQAQPAPHREDLPMMTPGLAPNSASGWPAHPSPVNDSDDEDSTVRPEAVDMDSILFATIHARQSGRNSITGQVDSKFHMPDTPVKHGHNNGMGGRLSLGGRRPWESTSKPAPHPSMFSDELQSVRLS
jgi:hypothetical protein